MWSYRKDEGGWAGFRACSPRAPLLIALALLATSPALARDLPEIRTSGELRICTAGSSANFYEENARAFALFLGVRPVVVALGEWNRQFVENTRAADPADRPESLLLAEGTCDIFPNDLHNTPARARQMRLVPYYRTRKLVIANRDLQGIIKRPPDLGGRRAAIQKGTAYDAWLLQQNATTLANHPISIAYLTTADSMRAVASRSADFTIAGAESAFYWVRSDIKNLDILFPVDDPVDVGWAVPSKSNELADELAKFFEKSVSVDSDMDRSWQKNYKISLVAYKLYELSFTEKGVDLELILPWLVPLGSATLGVLGAMFFWTRRLNREIAEHKRTAATLRDSQDLIRQSEERFRLLFNSGNDYVWLYAIDPDSGAPCGTFVEVNEVACARLGHSREEMLGMRPGDIEESGTARIDGDVLGSARAKGAMVERTLVAKDGRRILVEINARRIEYRGETLVLAICRDITERKAMEEELKRSNEELERFAYVASHDLRQPLRAVSSYLTLIERELGPALVGETREFFDFAKGGAKRMDALIVGLLEYSRIGRDTRPFEPVPLGEIVELALIDLAPSIADGQVVVADGPPTVRGRRAELERLFQNLIGNALKYRQPGRAPKVEITWRDGGEEWVVSVADNGIGIAPKDHERVFGIFQRLVSSQDYEGTGIGLAVCRKIVDHHRGRIWIDSTLGEGSAFHVALAKAEPAFSQK